MAEYPSPIIGIVMKYSETHEWVRVEGNVGIVGISKYAREELGEIVYVELPKPDAIVQQGDEIAVLESTKAAADIYTPISGTIVEVNTDLRESTKALNEDPENTGWLYKILLSDQKELDTLHDKETYTEMVSLTEDNG